MKVKYIFITVLMVNIIINGYTQTIEGLKVIPKNPPVSDEIEIGCYLKFPDSYHFYSGRTNINMNDTAIDISVYYLSGQLPSESYALDTISLGKLSGGNYTLRYALYDSAYTDTSFNLADTDSISFSVPLSYSSPGIENRRIIPENPTELDTVKLIGQFHGSTSPCGLKDSYVSFNKNDIVVEATYEVGKMQIPCTNTDTFALGQLAAGTYQLFYSVFEEFVIFSPPYLDNTHAETDTIELSVDAFFSSDIECIGIIPENPANADTVKLIGKIFSSSSPCGLKDSLVSIINDTVKVDAAYSLGLAQTPCTSKDTFKLGKLKKGTYKLFFSTFGDTIRKETFNATDTLEFSVVSNITNNIKFSQDLSVEIFPNPADDLLNVLFSRSVNAVSYELINSNGMLVQKDDVEPNTKKFQLQISDLPPGIYFMQLKDNEQIKTFKIVVQK
jgi:hypothetical protein